MSHYLIDNPPASRQYGDRYEHLTGCAVIHVAVSQIDVHAPDDGAENVARFISTRSDPGSYHEVGDSDSSIPLIPDHLRAFGVAASGVNQWAWHYSYACAAEDWYRFPEWDRRALRIGARAVAAFAVRWATNVAGNRFRAREVARWITAAQAYAGMAGMVHHGQFQSDRTDAWEEHPRRAELDALFALMVAGEIEALLVPEGGDEDMKDDERAMLAELYRQSTGKPYAPGQKVPRPFRSAIGGDGSTSLWALGREILTIVKAIARKHGVTYKDGRTAKDVGE